MKNGDIVVVGDGSYIQEITPNGLKSVYINYGEAKGLKHRVVSTDCKFPKESTVQPTRHLNNTIICGMEGCVRGRFFVVYHRFLECVRPNHTITIDCRTIEISHESFLSLKKQLNV